VHDEAQDAVALHRAANWLRDRPTWYVADVQDYLFAAVYPRIPVVKLALFPEGTVTLDGYRDTYEDARFVHLVRHPTPTQRSMQRVLAPRLHREDVSVEEEAARRWVDGQTHFLQFAQSTPNAVTVRGEDLLTHSESVLGDLLRRLHLPADQTAIDAMLHPERSPFAALPPREYFAGANDPTFEAFPALRTPRPVPASVAPPETWGIDTGVSAEIVRVAGQLGYWSEEG
jgi:hypothetical protein